MNRRFRNSNIEIVRILSMLLIVLGHYTVQTHWTFQKSNIILKVGVQSLWIGGKLGVNLFVLITAYFIANRTQINLKSVRTIWLQTLYYSITITLIGLAILHLPISLKLLVQGFLPVLFGTYWFVTAYIVLLFLSPYLNVGLNQLSKQQFQYLLITLTVIFLIGSIFQNVAVGFSLSDATTVIAIYPFGVYVRKFKVDFMNIRNIYYWLVMLLSIGIMVLSVLTIDVIHYLKPNLFKSTFAYERFLGSTSIFQILLAVSIFCLFLKLPLKQNRFINGIASLVFGVYLFHCQPVMTDYIWYHLVNAQKFSNSLLVFPFALLVVLLIFVVGIMYDSIRRLIFTLLEKIVRGIKESMKNFN